MPSRNYWPDRRPQAGTSPIRVLVVDDSVFMRTTITRHLSETPGIHVVGSACDGEEALASIPKLQPDVITLDVEMPRMDGLTTLREIMASYPRPVIMLSGLTKEGTRETVQALTWGAVDFVAKPDIKANMGETVKEVIAKIQRAVMARVYAIPKASQPAPQPAVQQPKSTRPLTRQDRVLVIGSSTGGPSALNRIIPPLSADLPAAVLVVQHMPVGFTRSLADRLDSVSNLSIREAVPGDSLEVGQVLIAPGGFHMTLDEKQQIALNQKPPVHGVRPAVDVTMTSTVQRFGASVIGVVLTGMGNDGAHGAVLIREAGGYVIAEDQSTCVVWGMPRSVVEAGAADEVVPLPGIPATIERVVNGYGT